MAALSERSYVLGHSDRELARLQVQARLIGPITRGFMRDSGIGPGMRVLDVGSGAGDVAFIAADLVGSAGKVVGVDRDAAAVAAAQQRAIAAAASNVTFLQGDPAEMAFDDQFDAVVGRYVLMFQADPAAMLREVAAHVRAGGVVVFHEPDRDGIRSYPTVGTYERCCRLVDETIRRWGGNPRMGISLHSTFIAAGLAAPTMRLESVIGGGSGASDHVHFEMDVVGSLASEIERLGIASGDEFHSPDLADRVLAEVVASGSAVIGRSEVGAWCRR
jgi:SAM-dependent methyltransferase